MAHPSARLTPRGRRLLVDRVRSGWTVTRAADAAGISRQTGSKWLRRFRREGEPGLRDRSSAVHHQARGKWRGRRGSNPRHSAWEASG